MNDRFRLISLDTEDKSDPSVDFKQALTCFPVSSALFRW